MTLAGLPQTPLPRGADPAEVRRHVSEAARAVTERVVADPDSTEWLRKWRPGGVAESAHLLAVMVDTVLPAPGCQPDMAPVLAIVRAAGADRAHQRLAREHAVRLAVHSSREILRLLDAELATRLDADVREALRERFGEVNDTFASEYLVAFLEESTKLAAEQEELSALLLDTTRAGFALGNDAGRVSVANDAFVKFFGADGDPVGRTWASVFDIDDIDDLRHPGDCAEAWRELVVRDQLGEERVVRVSLHGHRDRLQAIAVDVSVEAEYNRVHREFVRGLIHDLRSPLAVISGWSHTLVADADRVDAETRAEALGTVNRAARQLTAMSDNLLEITLLEGGTHHLDLELLDAGARLREFVRSGHCATVEGPEEAAMTADAGAFARMMTNLLDNAATHGRPPVRLRLSTDADRVRIDVVDQGEIDPGVLTAAEVGRVSGARGFGLGLRTTLLLARAHGGEVRLTSTEPTTFTLELPAAALP